MDASEDGIRMVMTYHIKHYTVLSIGVQRLLCYFITVSP